MTRLARCLGLLALPVLPGCITQALWHKEPVTPELHTVSVPCEVIDVTTAPDPEDPSIRVRFSPSTTAGAPPHLRQLHAGRPGSFHLDPDTTGDDWRWMPGAELFAPASWDLHIASGTYFRRAPANALLEFRGTVRAADLGEVVPADRVPATLQGGKGLPGGAGTPPLEAVALAAFRSHAWARLLPGLPATFERAVPLAWVDGDLNRIAGLEAPRSWRDAGDPARYRLEATGLLARLEDAAGNQRLVRIGLPVLLQSAGLELHRDGDLVHWSRSQVWTARLLLARDSDPGTRMPFPVPLGSRSFDYQWSRELERSDLALDALRTLATPLTAALDFLIMTNEPLSRLARFLAGDDEPLEPFRPKSGR